MKYPGRLTARERRNMEDATIYRKTAKGALEVAERVHGLVRHLRRLLIMVDGIRDVAELSVFARAGEAESAIAQLEAQGFIEVVRAGDRTPGRVAFVPAANDPAVFVRIKRTAMVEIRQRLGPVSTLLVKEIASCKGPLELRQKLRNIENALIQVLGPVEGAELARRIGGELTRMVPQKQRDDAK